MTNELILTAAVAVVRDGKLLMVRKHGSPVWILPGGKKFAHEEAEATVRREVKEELDCELTELSFFDEYVATAGHNPDRQMHVVLYTGELVGEPKASGEISEYCWISLEQRENLAPVHDQINPALQGR